MTWLRLFLIAGVAILLTRPVIRRCLSGILRAIFHA